MAHPRGGHFVYPCDAVSTSVSVFIQKKTALGSQARELVVRLRDYFERQQQNNGPLLPLNRIVERVAEALDIGRNTVSRITREKIDQEGMSENKLSTPNKKADQGEANHRFR
ncbi:hypothetical protein EVAR_85202_1 [Eumeta japonica]|uniref:Uncharacterized protein n=1 Tax=Eumeta variegata TaxID=151549 RepID=A0A4C1VYD7_EUMVA|nr:hypothetical protein EVAR_85202_1 [Eumeta japonica]